ncbi:hypothetical protein GIB67_026558 [Kingdonia uniflora]|uniref:Uncharacterized protein n=1 Tax=Kingdonia uniflora TaxID=39325 RepID=A0A7J7PBP9_9MAGN|nr:hypothetical protein GIB67_026558 [Kingdonia uniflora]
MIDQPCHMYFPWLRVKRQLFLPQRNLYLPKQKCCQILILKINSQLHFVKDGKIICNDTYSLLISQEIFL